MQKSRSLDGRDCKIDFDPQFQTMTKVTNKAMGANKRSKKASLDMVFCLLKENDRNADS
jgi:hypothetical protein